MQSVKSTEQGQKKGEMRMYENRTVEEVCREFSVDLRTGLSAAEVEVRQRHHGENELREAPPRSLIVRIGAQLCDSLIFVLFAAVGGYFITRRAFQPVRRIIQTAREIGEGNDLSRRIALGQGRDEVYTLAAEFDSMFARLEKAFEREKQFTSDASHELRTPTTVIISQCEYALERAKTLDEAREALHAILNQAEKMAVMISQLLMLARADKAHGKMQFETVNLSDLAMMVV